ncbi:MAG: ribbon-helix-helix protein, CopG family [Desulfuromonadaceae bacterium]|nr:ribbon-helix-helix protein, CopG family [Desulfuromonadaceae bacterium]
MKNPTKRRRDHHALKNVVSLRISDDELKLLQRIRAATSKSASEVMRDAFEILQRTCSPGFQN